MKKLLLSLLALVWTLTLAQTGFDFFARLVYSIYCDFSIGE